MTPIDKRKAELREYIKARENASEGPWNNCYHEKEYLIEYKLQPEGITRFAAIAGYKDNAEFITKAANESALIAEQLLECIEALERYKSACFEVEGKLYKIGAPAEKLLNKIGSEK